MKTLKFILIVMPMILNAQIGIGTTSPVATLDVATGVTTFEGIIPPRLTVAQLEAKNSAYGASQNGTIVYVTDGTSSPTTTATNRVRVAGYYCFDGTRWLPLSNPRPYMGSVYFGDLNDFSGTVSISAYGLGYGVSASKTQPTAANDVLITHNLNLPGNQYIRVSYVSNVENNLGQFNKDNDLTEPVIHDVTANSFKVYIQAVATTVQDVSLLVQLVIY